MNNHESGPDFDTTNTLNEIRDYIGDKATTARFFKDDTRAAALTEALGDLDNGNIDKAITVLERYEQVRRYRADEESDPEGIPAADHQAAIKLAGWVEFLKARRTSR